MKKFILKNESKIYLLFCIITIIEIVSLTFVRGGFNPGGEISTMLFPWGIIEYLKLEEE